MKALVATGYGLNIKRKLRFQERDSPIPGPQEVLIEIHAAGLNPVDYKFIYGMALPITRPKLPFGVGFDVAGVVTAVGQQVRDFRIGEEVYAKVPWDQMGTVATEIVVRADMTARKPRNLGFEEAAGLPLVSATVYDAFQVAEISKGTRLLIIGGSGGTGTFAVQYAKYLGAYVYATTSTANVELVRSLGADRVIDYQTESFRKIAREVDVVFDTVGGTYPGQSIKSVKRGGKIISIAGHHDNETLRDIGIAWIFRLAFLLKGSILMLRMWQKKVCYKHVWSYSDQEKLNYLRELFEAGHVRAIVDRVYPFSQAIEALLYLQTHRARGKVVVSMKPQTDQSNHQTSGR